MEVVVSIYAKDHDIYDRNRCAKGAGLDHHPHELVERRAVWIIPRCGFFQVVEHAPCNEYVAESACS